MSNWRELDNLLGQLFISAPSITAVHALFSLLERFPCEDGASVLWGAVHGLEDVPGCEAELTRSVQRRPAELTLIMLKHLINYGQSHVGEVDLYVLLQKVARRDDVEPEVRKTADHLSRAGVP